MRLVFAFEKGFVIAAFIFFSQAVLPLLQSDDLTRTSAFDPWGFFLQVAIYSGLGIYAFRVRRRMALLAFRSGFIWLLMLLAAASTAWSVDPSLTLRRALIVTLSSCFGLYLAARFSVREQVELIAVSVSLAALLSLAVVLWMPELGVMSGGDGLAGSWRGIYSHKNVMARFLIFGFMATLLRFLTTRRHRLLLSASLSIILLVAIESRSLTSLVILVAMLPCIPLLRFLRTSKKQVTAVASVCLLLGGLTGVWFASNVSVFFTFLGKDPTLTGRTKLWEIIGIKILQKPFLGYGFAAFWQGVRGESATVWTAIRWNAPNAHNGYLDLALNLGIVGLTVFAYGAIITLYRTIRYVRVTRNSLELWPLVCILLILVYNLDETGLMQSNSVYWVLFVTSCFSVYRPTMTHSTLKTLSAAEVPEFAS